MFNVKTTGGLNLSGAVTITAALLFLILANVGHGLHQRTWLRAQDDQMYWLAAAVSVVKDGNGLAEESQAQLIARARGHTINRATMRWDYVPNYIGALYLIDIAGGFWPESDQARSADYFDKRAAVGLSLGAFVASILAAVLIFGVLLAFKDPLLALAAAALALIACTQATFDLGASNKIIGNFAKGEHFGFAETLRRIALLLLDPGESTYVFGAAPRSVVTLLFVAVFLLRWKEHFAVAYAIFVPMALLHQAQAGLLLIMLVMIDLVVRPRLLVKPSIALPISAMLLVFAIRDGTWEYFASGSVLLGVLALMLVGGAVVWHFRRRADGTQHSWQAGIVGTWWSYDRITSMSVLVSDVLLLSIGWVTFFCVTWLGNWFATATESNILWNHIAGRMLGTFEPVFLLAGLFVGLNWLTQRFSLQPVVSVVGGAIVLVTVTVMWMAPPWVLIPQVIDRNTSAMADLNESLSIPIQKFQSKDEARYYYALARSLATGDPVVRRLWQ